jgi:Tfp pilus assembly protein PilF
MVGGLVTPALPVIAKSMLLRFFVLLLAFAPLARAQQVTKGPDSVEVDPAAEARNAATVEILRQANQMLGHGDTDGALAKLNSVILSDPRSLDAYVLRGAIYSKKKMWDKALADFEAAHLINPHSLIVMFNIAEVDFSQNKYDSARPGFLALSSDTTTDIGDLAAYKVFLCDLFGGHEDAAKKELDAFNEVGSHASYYFSNAAWALYHHQVEDARSWLGSAIRIYSPQKVGFYATSLSDKGYLPVPPPTPAPAPAPAKSP